MNIKKILILGGGGLVGSRIASKILEKEDRADIVLHSLYRKREQETIEALMRRFPGKNVSVRYGDILQPQELTDIIGSARPQIIVDCINTATALSYNGGSADDILMNLAGHVRELYDALVRNGTETYLKVGTTGTGGMGFDMPFTHGENTPSDALMKKVMMAGAHSMLLFFLSRAKNAPIIKEIKPATAVGWTRIATGEIHQHDEPIVLQDCEPSQGIRLEPNASLSLKGRATRKNRNLEGTAIDVGESGLYSLEEFKLLSDGGQMSYITCDEVADIVIKEIDNHATGKNITAALEGSVIPPSYRSGLIRQEWIAKMEEQSREAGIPSISFSALGPPRTSKLLFEAHLLCALSETADLEQDASVVSDKMLEIVRGDTILRTQMISNGIPILLPDGVSLMAGDFTRVPDPSSPSLITEENIERWCSAGWVDLRPGNIRLWQKILTEFHQKNGLDTSSSDSRFLNRHKLDPAAIVSFRLSRNL